MFCIFSWILSSSTSVLIVDRFVNHAEGVAVVLTIAREAVKVIVESLPRIFHIIISEVLEVPIV